MSRRPASDRSNAVGYANSGNTVRLYWQSDDLQKIIAWRMPLPAYIPERKLVVSDGALERIRNTVAKNFYAYDMLTDLIETAEEVKP